LKAVKKISKKTLYLFRGAAQVSLFGNNYDLVSLKATARTFNSA